MKIDWVFLLVIPIIAFTLEHFWPAGDPLAFMVVATMVKAAIRDC